MTTRKSKGKLSSVEALVAGDRDLMKLLMKETVYGGCSRAGAAPPQTR